MASVSFPASKAIEAFLCHYLTRTQLSHLSPFEYAVQYLELPIDEAHDREETFELFWGVACLEDEFFAFQCKQARLQEKHLCLEEEFAAKADQARLEQENKKLAGPETRGRHARRVELEQAVVAAQAEQTRSATPPPRQPQAEGRRVSTPPPLKRIEKSVPSPITPPPPRQPSLKRIEKSVPLPITPPPTTPPPVAPYPFTPEAPAEELTPELQERIARIEQIHRNTEKLQAENAILEQNISRIAERLRRISVRPARQPTPPPAEAEEAHAEPAGLFDSFSSSSSSTNSGSAFDSVQAKLEEYKATIRGKIDDRYHTIDGIAAAADAHQQKIIARLAQL